MGNLLCSVVVRFTEVILDYIAYRSSSWCVSATSWSSVDCFASSVSSCRATTEVRWALSYSPYCFCDSVSEHFAIGIATNFKTNDATRSDCVNLD
jgi:hypothetical protein